MNLQLVIAVPCLLTQYKNHTRFTILEASLCSKLMLRSRSTFVQLSSYYARTISTIKVPTSNGTTDVSVASCLVGVGDSVAPTVKLVEIVIAASEVPPLSISSSFFFELIQPSEKIKAQKQGDHLHCCHLLGIRSGKARLEANEKLLTWPSHPPEGSLLPKTSTSQTGAASNHPYWTC